MTSCSSWQAGCAVDAAPSNRLPARMEPEHGGGGRRRWNYGLGGASNQELQTGIRLRCSSRRIAPHARGSRENSLVGNGYLIVIGASAGGLGALRTILSSLPGNL